VQAVRQLLLLLQDLLFVRQAVAKRDVLKPVLVHFLVFQGVHLLPLIKDLLGYFLTSATEDCILGDASFQFLELLLNLMALGLLFIQFGLKFRCHFVVPVLCLFQVEPDLMNVGEGVEVLVLVHADIRGLVLLFVAWVHQYDLSL
jgi:hypothetical protein